MLDMIFSSPQFEDLPNMLKFSDAFQKSKNVCERLRYEKLKK